MNKPFLTINGVPRESSTPILTEQQIKEMRARMGKEDLAAAWRNGIDANEADRRGDASVVTEQNSEIPPRDIAGLTPAAATI